MNFLIVGVLKLAQKRTGLAFIYLSFCAGHFSQFHVLIPQSTTRDSTYNMTTNLKIVCGVLYPAVAHELLVV